MTKKWQIYFCMKCHAKKWLPKESRVIILRTDSYTSPNLPAVKLLMFWVTCRDFRIRYFSRHLVIQQSESDEYEALRWRFTRVKNNDVTHQLWRHVWKHHLVVETQEPEVIFRRSCLKSFDDPWMYRKQYMSWDTCMHILRKKRYFFVLLKSIFLTKCNVSGCFIYLFFFNLTM